MIRNWGTFSTDGFDKQFIGHKKHPLYTDFESILFGKLFADPIVDPGNLWEFADRKAAAIAHSDADVLHT
jgi:hypothetical protein